MISNEAVKRLINTPEWHAVQAHIEAEITSLSSLAGIDFNSPVASAIEGRARQVASERLIAILAPFAHFAKETDASTLTRDKGRDAGLE